MESMKKKSSENWFIVVGVIIIVILFFVIIIFLIKQSKNNTKSDSFSLTNLSLDGDMLSKQKSGVSGKYKDNVCDVSFNYPKNWVKSDVGLSLSPDPLSYAVFNEPAKGNSSPKNSIFSFVCYDAKKYSFDQFVAQNTFSQEQAETISVGSKKWQRLGNFIYIMSDDKLYIFQMFFTKYDLRPESGYEEIFLDIIKSVK